MAACRSLSLPGLVGGGVLSAARACVHRLVGCCRVNPGPPAAGAGALLPAPLLSTMASSGACTQPCLLACLVVNFFASSGMRTLRASFDVSTPKVRSCAPCSP